ncbi:hypothetical protein MBLNU459_g5507t1 [Dothideomycetes sp. NU459]
MFNFRSFGLALPRWLTDSFSGPGLDLPPVQVHDIEERPEKRARTLKHLLKANHINHSIIYHHLEFHNHTPHILGSAYLLGASADQLTAIYEKESSQLEPWHDAPGEISIHDWRDYLGKRDYQRAWVDFLEDQLVQHGYDWRTLLDEFLFGGKEPLINNLIAGLGHPLIHLGYAFELSSRTIAVEAVALVAAFYNKQHIYLDNPSYTKPSPWTNDSPFAVLQKLHQDSRLDSFFAGPAPENYDTMVQDDKKEEILLEYWNSWVVTDPKIQFRAAQRAAVAILVSTHQKGSKFDFFLCHLLTSSHAVRIVAPNIPNKWHIPLIRQWWLFVVTTYIAQLRPTIDTTRIDLVELAGRDWKWVDDRAVNGAYAQDAHFVKGKYLLPPIRPTELTGWTACRAMKEAANTWGDESQYFLKAAVDFSEKFDGWGGFGEMSQEEAEAAASKVGYAGSY